MAHVAWRSWRVGCCAICCIEMVAGGWWASRGSSIDRWCISGWWTRRRRAHSPLESPRPWQGKFWIQLLVLADPTTPHYYRPRAVVAIPACAYYFGACLFVEDNKYLLNGLYTDHFLYRSRYVARYASEPSTISTDRPRTTVEGSN
jgi:hypothetical protein